MGARPVTVLAPYAPVGTGMLAPIPTSQERLGLGLINAWVRTTGPVCHSRPSDRKAQEPWL